MQRQDHVLTVYEVIGKVSKNTVGPEEVVFLVDIFCRVKSQQNLVICFYLDEC